MTSAILNTNPTQSMTSNEIATLTGKSHANVMRDIREMLDAISKDQINFEAIYFDSYERPQSCYRLPYDETICLLTGYDAKARMAVIKRWKELEANQAKPVELSRMDILQLAIDSEKGRLVAIEQRDHAIATKAQIGSKREATAMATASAAKKENTKLKALMGEATENASIIAVQVKTGVKTYQWRDLKNYCEFAGMAIGKSFNPGLQLTVNTYPSGAWFEVYGVDLAELFGEVAA